MRQEAFSNVRRHAPHLLQRARSVVANLELVSHGGTAAWNPGGSRSVPGSKPPSGESRPVFSEALERLSQAESTRSVELAVQWAEKALEAARRQDPTSRPEGESLAQRAYRIVEEGEGLSLADAAQHFRVPQGEVKQARLNAGRFVGSGKRLPNDAPDQRQAVRSLKKSGLSQTDIAKQLGISQPTVSRLLQDRAA